MMATAPGLCRHLQVLLPLPSLGGCLGCLPPSPSLPGQALLPQDLSVPQGLSTPFNSLKENVTNLQLQLASLGQMATEAVLKKKPENGNSPGF